jgi:putative tryptophan/tyrosine transport system substrate-binding protein
MITRRRLLRTVAGGLLAAPLAAIAQPAGKVWRIGFLGDGSRDDRVGISLEPFREGLRELGYVDGKNIVIMERWSDGKSERVPELLDELIRLKVDAIVTHGVRAGRAAKAATKTIPIVVAITPDPVGAGLVASLARPGGNLTGLSDEVADLAEKEIQIFQEALPRLKRIAFLWNEDNPGARLTFDATLKAARKFGLGVTIHGVTRIEQLESTVDRIAKERPDGVIVIHDVFIVNNRARIAQLALTHRLPTVCAVTPFAVAGGLMAYAPNYGDRFRRSATYVDKIFKGAKPADLPVEQPTTFELVINLKTAKALGLMIPQSLLGRADEIIQ